MYEEEDNGLVMRNRQNGGVFDASGFESKIADFYTAKQSVAAIYDAYTPYSSNGGQMPMYGQMPPQYPMPVPYIDYSGMPMAMPDGQFVGPVMTPQGMMMAPRPMMGYQNYIPMKGQPMKQGQPPMGMPMQQPLMPGYQPGFQYMGGVPLGHPGNLQNAVMSIQSNQRQHITQNYINKIRQQDTEKQNPMVKKQDDDSTELKKEDGKEAKQTETPPPSAIEKPDHFITGKLMQNTYHEPMSALDIRLEDLQKPVACYQSFTLGGDYESPVKGTQQSEDLSRSPGPDVKQEQTETEVHQPTPIQPVPPQYFNSPAFMGNASFTAPLFTDAPMMPNQAFSYEPSTGASDDAGNDVYFDVNADLNFNFDFPGFLQLPDTQNQSELVV